MPVQQLIFKQIEQVTINLISLGLSVRQNFPSIQNGRITYSGMQNISIAMKNIAYFDIYKTLEESKNYNLQMIDGGLIQMLYLFDENILISHRLAFFPSPNLESFQNNPEPYITDELYSDIMARNIVTFPIRFDYDLDDSRFKEIEHPKTHATLGQYKNCRIPVSEPLTPEIFILFILRNFYNTAFKKFTRKFVLNNYRFSSTISQKEKSILHFGIY